MTQAFHMGLTGAEPLPLHLVEEINHRVINEYAEAIAGLSRAAADPACDVRQALRQAADRLHAHAENHRALLPPMEGRVNLADYMGRLCASFSRAFLADRQIALTLETDEVWLVSDRAWRLGLIIAELIRNAARHGLGGRGGTITVQITRSCGDVVCLVGDDGRIKPAGKSGRGMALMRALASDLGGSVEWWRDECGCLVQLRAPAELRSA
jgi:two-component sensor histidine kinase